MGEKKRVVLVFHVRRCLCLCGDVFRARGAKVDADNGMSCMKIDLDAVKYKNTMPSPTIDILYNVPSCYASAGYQMTAVSIYQGYVRVTYQSSGGVLLFQESWGAIVNSILFNLTMAELALPVSLTWQETLACLNPRYRGGWRESCPNRLLEDVQATLDLARHVPTNTLDRELAALTPRSEDPCCCHVVPIYSLQNP
jgi:hypothetical protein